MTFVGSQENGPSTVAGESFPRSHEGYSGWTIQQIADIVPSHALDGDPHIILLHIGTNDLFGSPDGAVGRLEDLIDEILDANPSALLVVSSVIPLSFGSDGLVENYNQQIPGLVQERTNLGYNILFVDQFEGFPNSELADGVHPNQSGYERMARKWYDAIEDYLN